MTFLRFFFFFVWCAMGMQSIKFHPQISLVSPLSRFARFLHKKNSLHVMAEQGPKVGDARSLWNFTPSPGILLYACSFFLSLCLLRACVAMMMMMSWFWGRSSLAFEFLKRWCENDIRFLVLLLAVVSLSKTRLLSRGFRFCASLVLSLKTFNNVFFFIFNAHQNASHRTTKQDGRNRRLKI